MASKVCIVVLNSVSVRLLKVPIVAHQGGVLNGGTVHLCVHECDFCLALEQEEHRPCMMR